MSQQQRVRVTSATKLFLLFTGLFLLAQIVVAIVAYVNDISLLGANTTLTYVTLLINELVVILLPSLIYLKVRKLSFREVLRLRAPGLKPSVIIALGAVPAYMTAMALNSVVLWLLSFAGELPESPLPAPATVPQLLLGFLMVAVLPGVCEEVFNRGILLSAFERRGTARAVALSGLVFGLFHYDITNFFGPVLLGAMIAFYVVRTNSIFAGMLAHFLNNAIAEILTYLTSRNGGSEETLLPGNEMLWLLLIGACSAVAMVMLLRWFRQVTEGSAVMHPPIQSRTDDLRAVFTHWPMVISIVLYLLITITTVAGIAVNGHSVR